MMPLNPNTDLLQMLASAMLLAGFAAAQTQPGALRGSVNAEDGASMRGAVVSYYRMTRLVGHGSRARLAPGEAEVRSSTSSDTTGGFSVSNVPAGDYVLCAEVPASPYLNPCKWSSAPKVTLAPGALQRPALILKRGVFLKVRINDPQGLLPTVKDNLSRPNLIVGVVFGLGAFLAADLVRSDAGGREYQMAIPAGIPLKLWLFSRHVVLRDSKGMPVDNSGAKVPFQAAAGQDQVFTLNVAGRDPRSQ